MGSPFRRIEFLFLLAAAFLMSAQVFSQSAPAEEIDGTGPAVKFEFKYQKGDTYRILSTVDEDVFVNGTLDHRAQIVNRVSAEVTSLTKDGAVHDCTFMTTENSSGAQTGANFSWGEEYKSVFTRDKSGVYTISDEYFMPTVRDVPQFPDKAVSPGESWTANGHEAHDLRRGFNLDKPYKVPFTATYTYLGTVGREKKKVSQMTYVQSSQSKTPNNKVTGKSQGNTLHVLRVTYSMNFDHPVPSAGGDWSEFPVTMMGFSDELIYWDAEKGAIDHYTETFRILIETSYGNLFEFRGTAHAEVTDFKRTATKENVAAVKQQVHDMGIENVTVKQGEKGLTLSIENIGFKADSAELQESELLKLEQISRILEAFPQNDILVCGHTARVGSEESCQRLSEERAQSVADQLVSLGVRDRYHVFTQGAGSKMPIAPNTTEAGRSKNRRVEIIIMDK